MSPKIMSIYLKIVALMYLNGGIVHIGNLLGLGQVSYTDMNPTTRVAWQVGDVLFAVFDLIAVVGLWQGKRWGIVLWFILAGVQLVMYTFFTHIFTEQPGLIVFHLVTVGIYIGLRLLENFFIYQQHISTKTEM